MRMVRAQSPKSKRGGFPLCKAPSKTGGDWEPSDRPVYFVASVVDTLSRVKHLHRFLLIAVNEIRDGDIDEIRDFMTTSGCKVFIDSGAFNLSTRHAAKHEITMNEALSLAPHEVDGFDDLFAKYVRLMADFGDKCWGYIEIDQGGRDNKIKTRAKLEGMGLRPIPVYHPFNDGWGYFDELASKYDRICLGNVVQADPATRKRLIATAWERRRKFPGLWIHALGLTPSDLTAAYPIGSCDSSTWISDIRWGTHDAKICNQRAWALGSGFTYDKEAAVETPRGNRHAVRLAGYDAAMVSRTMQIMERDFQTVLGADTGMFGA